MPDRYVYNALRILPDRKYPVRLKAEVIIMVRHMPRNVLAEFVVHEIACNLKLVQIRFCTNYL